MVTSQIEKIRVVPDLPDDSIPHDVRTSEEDEIFARREYDALLSMTRTHITQAHQRFLRGRVAGLDRAARAESELLLAWMQQLSALYGNDE